VDLDEGFRRFAEHAPIHFGITDPEAGGTFLAWNQISEEMFGYSAEDAIGVLTARDLHASEEEFLAVLEAVDRGAFDGECVFLRKDGSTFPGRLRVVPVLGPGGGIVERCGFIEDLTDTKRMLAELEEQRQHHYQEDRIYQMGRMSGVIAHDINNLLSGILFSSQLAKEDLGADHPCSADLDTIESAVTSAAGLMRKLLSFTGRQVSERQVVGVRSWIGSQHSFLERLIRPTTQLEIDCQSERSVWMDPADLQQVVVNLLVNGDNAMAEGGVLTLGSRDAGEEVEVFVADTGRGIPPELVEKIFQPYFTTRDDGTGLGLSTVREIVESAGGTLRLTSEVGMGTCVTLSLPVEASDVVMSTAPSSSITSPGSFGGQVLVVDDQPEVRTPLLRALRRAGFQVREAESLREARSTLQGMERLRVLVVDSKLTDGSGEDLIPLVRERFPQAKCLLISGYLSTISQQGLALFDARLAKPFSLQQLYTTLEFLLTSGPEDAHP